MIPVHGLWGSCTGITVFVNFRRFSSIFFGFLRFSSGFVGFRPPVSSAFIDFLRFSSVSGMDLERSCLDLGTGSEVNLGWIWVVRESGSDPVICPICPIRPTQIGILELNCSGHGSRESWPDPPADTFWTLFLTSTRTLSLPLKMVRC